MKRLKYTSGTRLMTKTTLTWLFWLGLSACVTVVVVDTRTGELVM